MLNVELGPELSLSVHRFNWWPHWEHLSKWHNQCKHDAVMQRAAQSFRNYNNNISLWTTKTDSAVCGKFYIQVIQFKYFVFARMQVIILYSSAQCWSTTQRVWQRGWQTRDSPTSQLSHSNISIWIRSFTTTTGSRLPEDWRGAHHTTSHHSQYGWNILILLWMGSLPRSLNGKGRLIWISICLIFYVMKETKKWKI